MILLPCTFAHTSSIPMGAIYLYMQGHFLYALIQSYTHWMQCQSLKSVLSQCSQIGFVTVDDFIALYTCSYVFYFHGCNVFIHATTFFTLADTILYPLSAPIFFVITKVWPCANRAMVTNNSTMLIKVMLIKVVN